MRKRYAITASAVAALAIGGATAATAAPQNLEVVNGNNGTVKADVVDGCSVTLTWYGMDASANTVVSFDLHGASGDGQLLLDAWSLDADGAQGGDLDGTKTYDLGPAVAATGATEAHVKVTTHTSYSQGADTKYKVIWVSGCEAPDPPDDGPDE